MQKGSVNKVVLVGHLGGDPETRFTASGAAVANFNLATNESWRDANSEIQDKTEWHRCVMFGKSAELGGDLLKKGQLGYLCKINDPEDLAKKILMALKNPIDEEKLKIESKKYSLDIIGNKYEEIIKRINLRNKIN